MRTSHVLAAAAAALVLAAMVATRVDVASGPGPSDLPRASTTATPGTGPEPAPSTPSTPSDRDQTKTLTIAGVDLAITGTSVRIGDVRDDGTLRVTVRGTPSYATDTAGAEVDENGDRSVLLLSDGAPVAALTRVDTPPDEGSAPDGEGSASPRGPTVLLVGTDALGSAVWAQREGEGGRSLAVVPEPWVRGAGDAALDLLAAQVVAVAPEADSATMRDQLRCHHIGAPDKASWNLEPWRPDVGLFGTVAARCNPTGEG